MTHDELQPLLDAWLDHELDPGTALAVDEHLRDCGPCSAWLTERRALLGQLQLADLHYPLPPQLTARIATQLGTPRRRPAVRAPWFGALAASLTAAIGGFLLGHSWPQAPDRRAELVGASVRAQLSAHPIDVLSSDHHTVKPWLSTQLPFSPPVPELTDQGELLLGARVDYLGSMRVAALVYQHGHHQINVYIWPRAAMRLDTRPGTLDGYHLLITQAGAFTAAMVSDLSAAELAAFRDRWRAHAEAGGDRG